MHSADTIAAISSAVGPAARMIVRLSGGRARDVARRLSPAAQLEHAAAAREMLGVAGLCVPVWIYAFHGPHSYTGEDSIELHLPGNPLLARMVLDACLHYGARLAEPGEFTARAYFNGRMDLAAAEGVAATIAAQNEAELEAARQLLAGELARRLRPVTDALTETLALVEAGIDFSDEDVTFIAGAELESRIVGIDRELEQIVNTSARFDRLAHEPHIVLVGRPNAGKSTLLNALAGRERAVVSPVAGTTRDVVSADVQLSRGIVKLLDVAGLDDHDSDSDSADAETSPPAASIDRQMRGHALAALRTADAVLLVQDATDRRPPLNLSRRPDQVIRTKADLLRVPRRPDDPMTASATTGLNMDLVRAELDRLAFGGRAARPSLALNARHLTAVAAARTALGSARANAHDGAELVALGLREALDALGAILGHVTPDDVLGHVFSTFCIGK